MDGGRAATGRETEGQLTFADLEAADQATDGVPTSNEFSDRALFETTLVVVDLETTGSDHSGDRITEIGAVKIRGGGEVIGEFATLVDPGRPIPPQIVTLTGITTAMVTDAPASSRCCPHSSSSPAGGRSWSPTTPASTWGSCGRTRSGSTSTGRSA